jgi:hypothetical protein
MKKIDFGQAIQILSNIGVIVGIVFVGMQLRQNQASLDQANRLDRIETMEVSIENFGRARSWIAQDSELADIWRKANDGENLTQLEVVRFGALCEETLWSIALAYRRSRELADDRLADGLSLGAARLVGRPTWDACWRPRSQQREGIRGVFLRLGYDDFVNSVEAEKATPR